MVQDADIKIILIIWVCVCAWLDWRHREVSNWLTIVPMIAAGIYALLHGENALLTFIAALLGAFILFYLGTLGGADAKILVVLAGFWPAAFLGSVLTQGVWGLIVLLRKGRNAGFRAVPSYAVGTAISWLIRII